jgi:hypothetical protein
MSNLSDERARAMVTVPLAAYVEANRAAADAFLRARFVEHRVTAIGETHETLAAGFTPGHENVCVRLFLRDFVLQLYNDPAARLAALVLEVDETWVAQAVGALEQMTFPAGTVNRKAYWMAQAMSHDFNEARRTALLAISQSCDETRLQVFGLDATSQLPDRQELEDYLNARDITGNPGESNEDYNARVRAVMDQRAAEMAPQFAARDESAFQKFRDQVMPALGADGRALIYYGADHVMEAPIEPHANVATDFVNFVRKLERAHVVGDGAVYTAVTVYEGMGLGGVSEHDAAVRALPQPIMPSLMKIYDVLRAEFDDVNLGFDLDQAQNDDIILHNSSGATLGQAFDAYLYFRNVNSWDGNATLADTQYLSSASGPPELRLSAVFPGTGMVGNTAFVYGYKFPGDGSYEVRFGSVASPSVRWLNEDALAVQVPQLGDVDPPAGFVSGVTLRRTLADGSVNEFTLDNAFTFAS